jgi:hypothetical protein
MKTMNTRWTLIETSVLQAFLHCPAPTLCIELARRDPRYNEAISLLVDVMGDVEEKSEDRPDAEDNVIRDVGFIDE